MISFLIGGICGVFLMCLLQINRDNEAQRRINKAIDFIKHNAIYEDFNMLGGDCEELIEILGGDVDDE